MTTIQVTREQIGRRIKAGRGLRGWTQEEMATKLAEALDDDTWTHRIVSNLETGDRRIDAEILAVIADLQGQEITWYYEPLQPYTAPAAANAVNPRYLKSGRTSPVISLDSARAAKERRERAPVRQAA